MIVIDSEDVRGACTCCQQHDPGKQALHLAEPHVFFAHSNPRSAPSTV
jgi:hypothetical protein